MLRSQRPRRALGRRLLGVLRRAVWLASRVMLAACAAIGPVPPPPPPPPPPPVEQRDADGEEIPRE